MGSDPLVSPLLRKPFIRPIKPGPLAHRRSRCAGVRDNGSAGYFPFIADGVLECWMIGALKNIFSETFQSKCKAKSKASRGSIVFWGNQALSGSFEPILQFSRRSHRLLWRSQLLQYSNNPEFSERVSNPLLGVNQSRVLRARILYSCFGLPWEDSVCQCMCAWAWATSRWIWRCR
jgi:hypothetical protein